MKVLLVGGGSGGHITPLLAVAHELRQRQPQAVISYVLEKGSKFDDLPRASKDIDDVHTVRTGKLRRYHGDSWLKRLVDVPTNLRNLRDSFYVVAGYGQARKLLRKLQPDVVFIKGSSVGVPVGKACVALGIPYFTHDSDSVASLTNRILAKNAVIHAVGFPVSDSDKKVRYTGIPLGPQYRHVTTDLQQQYRRQLGLPTEGLVLTVTGGSLGAKRLNDAFLAVAEALLEEFPWLRILHQTGSKEPLYGKLPATLSPRAEEMAFTDNLAALTGAADLVVARAGATTIAELAVQGKACLFVPNPQLTGGQQTKNGQFLASHQAAEVVDEATAADATSFGGLLSGLLESMSRRKKYAQALHKLAKADAAKEIADIIIEIASKQKANHVSKKES